MKPTSAQLVIIHTAESAGISGFMTLALGVAQYWTTNGLNIPGLLGVLGTGFVACMLMMYKSVKASPQLAQAAMDTANEAKAGIVAMLPMLHAHGPVVNPPTATVSASAAAQPAPVQIMPNPAFSATSVPQQPFPGQLNWTGLQQAVKP